MNDKKEAKKVSWWKFRKMKNTRKEYAYTFWLGIIVGSIANGAIGGILTMAGLVSGVIWVTKTIKMSKEDKQKEKDEKNKAV